MKKSQIISLISTAIVLIVALIFVFIFVNKNQNQSNMPDIKYTYTLSDFPDNDLLEENARQYVDRLNQNYQYLRDNVDYSHYDIWVDIGNTKQALSDFDGAVEAWEYAISINEKSTLAYANLANYYKSFAQDRDKAQHYYDMVVQKDTIGYFQDYLSYAELYMYDEYRNPAKIEIIMLNGVEKASWDRKLDFYKFLYNLFLEEGNQGKIDNYKQEVLKIDPNFKF